ncbi:MAG: alpha/beta fold hydrolase [Acidimicrobiales bacterium]
MTTGTAGVRPAWVSDELFPFQSRFVDVDGNSIHYVDEGVGPVLLMLHGNPTWSFLYRDLVAGLRDRSRCIALDYPGFGLSHPRPGYGFGAAEHSSVVEAFVAHLDLSEVTLMVHDWGGPIGLGAAGRAPERYRALVIANTWAWPVSGNRRHQWFSTVMGGPVGRFLIGEANAFVNVLVPGGHRRRRLTAAERAHYRGPFTEKEAREPMAVLPREIVAASGFLSQVEANLARLADRPTLITWADRDRAFRQDEKRRFESLFPHHTTVDLRAAGHFVPDDAGDQLVLVIRSWWEELADEGAGS